MARARREARGSRFLSRYPVLLIVPLSVLFLALGYAYAARLAASWGDIHGVKAVFVVAGVALGAALAGAAVVGARQGAGSWLLVPGVVVIAGIIVTRQQIAPAIGPTGKITTGFEAAAFALLSVVWCVSAFAFLGLLPRMWRARMAFSRPKAGLHITRAARWSAAPSAPIPLAEWRRFAESRDDLVTFDPLADDQGLPSPRVSPDFILTRPDLIARNPGLARALPPGMPIYTFTYQRDGGSRMYLTWFNGEIVIAGLGQDRTGDIASMQPIASSLAAHLVDDNGKVYEPV